MSSESSSSSEYLTYSPPTVSEFPTQNLPSEGEYTDVQLDEESLWDKSPITKIEEPLEEEEYAGKEEYLEEEEYSGQEGYLEEEEYPGKENHLEEENYPGEENHLEEREYPGEEEHLEEEKHIEERQYPGEEKYLENEEYPEEEEYSWKEEYLEEEGSPREKEYLEGEDYPWEEEHLEKEEYPREGWYPGEEEYPGKEWHLEEEEYPEKEGHLEEEEYPGKEGHLEEEEYPGKEGHLEEEEYPGKEGHLEEEEYPGKEGHLEEEEYPGKEGHLEEEEYPGKEGHLEEEEYPGKEGHLEEEEYPGKEGHLEEEEYPGKEGHLEEEEYPGKEGHLEEEEYPGKEGHLEEEEYPGKKEHLEEEEYPGKEGHLEEEEYPGKEGHLEEEEYPGRKEHLEEEEYPGDEEYLEEDEYLEEEKYVKGKDYMHKEEYQKMEEYLSNKDPSFEKYLGKEFKAAYSTLISPHLNARRPIVSTSHLTPLFAVPRTITVSPDAEPAPDSPYNLPLIRHQASQTEWVYQSKLVLPSKSKRKTDEETVFSLKSDSEATIASDLQQEGTAALDSWNRIIDEAVEKEMEGLDETFLNSSYQSVFKAILKEMSARSESDDFNLPLAMLLEIENRKKLGVLMKRNFELFKETILWLMRKRDGIKSAEMSTFTFRLSEQSNIKKSQSAAIKKHRRVVHHKKKVELDTEWIEEMKVHRSDRKLILYPNESVFHILFPDGTGQIHYPSGRLALLISRSGDENFTYVILEDRKQVRALINNSGHATFYDEMGEICLLSVVNHRKEAGASLSPSLGYYFPKGKNQKAWNWWNLQIHVHMPPFQPIFLKINHYIHVQIRSQDKIIFNFQHEKQRICLNLGTRFKFINSETLQDMKEKKTLEFPGTTARKVQILLGKMSRILHLLTVSDLENFTEAAKMLLAGLIPKKSLSWY